MPLAQIKQTRAIVAALGAGALILAAAGCTSSGGGGNSTAPTTGVTQSAGPGGSAGPSGSSSPTAQSVNPKPLSYKQVTKKQGAALDDQIGGLPGVTSTAYYPDSHVFEVYLSASASKLDRTNVQNLVKQELAKSAKN